MTSFTKLFPKRTRLSTAILFACCLSLYAQTPFYRIEPVSLEQGVSHNFIQCLLQDHKGFLWFGTLFGLIRYDGYNYVTYRHDPSDPYSLSHDDIAALYEDAEGKLWIGTCGGGLNMFDPVAGKFTRYVYHPADSSGISNGVVWTICEDRFGMLWLGTDGGGLCKFDKKSRRFTRYQHDSQRPGSLSSNYVATIYEDKSGTLWIGTYGGGLCKFDRANDRFVQYRHEPGNPKSLSFDRVKAIYEDKSGALWIGTGSGLDRFNRDKNEFEHYQYDPANPKSLSGSPVNNIFEDKSGVLWIGTARGLNRFGRERGEFLHFFDNSSIGMGANYITGICQDNAGTLWVGTYHDGLKKISESRCKFGRYYHQDGHPEGLSHHAVFSVFEDSRERLWIGTVAGLDLLDEKQQRFKHYLPEFDPQNLMNGRMVDAICEDKSGTLWLGTTRGLQKFDPTHSRFQSYLFNPSDTTSVSHNWVTALCLDRFGALWVGTRWGLNRFDQATGRFTRFKNIASDPHSVTDNYVVSIYEDKSGTLWIGTYGGLNRYDRERQQFTSFRHDLTDPHSLSHDYCFAIYEDRQDRLWVGTGGGLNLFNRDTGTFTHYTEKDGLPNSVICGILEDAHGRLWLSTQKGLSRFDPKAGVFASFDLSDGLLSNLFTLSTFCQRRNGMMVFGGFFGVTYFHPDSLRSNPFVPPVVITSFKKFDNGKETTQDVAAFKELALSYRENFFAFEFAALNFVQPEKNQYAYKLEGLETDWIQAGNRRYASYTNLAPGEYVFRVKGSNNDGVWNEQGAAIKIRITPPFWKTTWFAALCLGALIMAIVFAYNLSVRLKVKQLLAIERARRLENEQVRKKAANDFHDELGHRLTKIALFSEIIKNGENGGNGEFAAYLDKIIDDCQRLTNDTRDFIWTLDPNKDSLHEVILYLKDFADKLFDRTGVAFRLQGLAPELEKVKLSADAKRQLTLIFKEGMTNILKHAECRNATLQVEARTGYFQVVLRDDGRGCNGNVNGNGYGFKNMRERAEKIHGLLRVHSQPGEGTQIELLAKLNENHETSFSVEQN